MDKTLDYYLGLPYTIRLVPEMGGGWFVEVAELPGCMSEGDDPDDAIAMIRDAMRCWLEVALEDGLPIPEPREMEEYSGKFVVRVPRWLHRELVRTTDQEGVSLNHFVSTALARAVGEHAASPARPSVVRGEFRETGCRADGPGGTDRIDQAGRCHGSHAIGRRDVHALAGRLSQRPSTGGPAAASHVR